MRLRLSFSAASVMAGLGLTAAAPVLAQIVVVPLDPVPGQGLEDDGSGTGLIPTEPVTGFEPLPPDPNTGFEPLPPDPGAGWEPFGLEPADPNMIEPWSEITDDGTAIWEPLPPGSIVGQDVTTVAEDTVTAGTGAVLKGLDKLAGTVEEMQLAEGQIAEFGWLQIALGECRYPQDNPSGDAYAWLEITEEGQSEPMFSGWMIASSPGLNALDHPRFDVWVLNCTVPEEPDTTEAAATQAD